MTLWKLAETLALCAAAAVIAFTFARVAFHYLSQGIPY